MTAARRNEPTAYMISEAARCSLSLLHQSGPVSVYRLGRPDTGLGATRLIFTDKPLVEQIILTGDLHPGDGHGLVGPAGYGLSWWVSRLSPDYLCGKFLPRKYVREYAAEDLKAILDGYRTEYPDGAPAAVAERIRKIRAVLCDSKTAEDNWYAAVEDPLRSAESFYETYCNIFRTTPDREGCGYDPADAGWLVAIQRRFAVCYCEMNAASTSVVQVAS